MSKRNEHRRQDCQYIAGCTGCEDSPPAGVESKTYDLTPYEGGSVVQVQAHRVVDRGRNLMTYQIDSAGSTRTIVLLPGDLAAIRALLEAIELDDRPYRACLNPQCWCWMPVDRERRESDTHSPAVSSYEKAWVKYFTFHSEEIADWQRSWELPTCNCPLCAEEPRDTVRVRVLLNVHHPEKCAGRPCCIHNPSDHHMVTWQQNWRNDRGLMERMCQHGVGHPDPDDIAYKVSIGSHDEGVHGCDGCCWTPQPPEGAGQ